MQRFLIYLFLQTLYMFQAVRRPSSGAHNCRYSFKYCQPMLLVAGVVDEMELMEFQLIHVRDVMSC